MYPQIGLILALLPMLVKVVRRYTSTLQTGNGHQKHALQTYAQCYCAFQVAFDSPMSLQLNYTTSTVVSSVNNDVAIPHVLYRSVVTSNVEEVDKQPEKDSAHCLTVLREGV